MTTLLGLLLCTACEKEKIPLVGERLPISTLVTNGLNTQQVRGRPILLSPPLRVNTWEQPDRLASHDKGHLGFHPGTSALKVAWTSRVSSSDSDARLLATPVVVPSGIFLMDHQGSLVKVDPTTEEILFRISLAPEGKEGEPTLGGGCAIEKDVVFAATSYGELLSLSALSGEILWRQPLQSPARGSPTLSEGKIYVVTLQNQLHAFDAKTGQLLWTHAGMPEGLGILGLAAPAVSGDIVVVTYTSGEVCALRAQTGNVIWAEIISGPRHLGEAQNVSHIRANPVIHQGILYVISYSGQMVALNLNHGQRLWEASLGSTQTPVFDGQTLFILTNNQEIAALDTQTGQILWAHSFSQFAFSPKEKENTCTWLGPLLADKTLYFLSSQGLLVALDPQTGTPLSDRPLLPLHDSFALPPLIAQGTLYALSEEGRLYAIR